MQSDLQRTRHIYIDYIFIKSIKINYCKNWHHRWQGVIKQNACRPLHETKRQRPIQAVTRAKYRRCCRSPLRCTPKARAATPLTATGTPNFACNRLLPCSLANVHILSASQCRFSWSKTPHPQPWPRTIIHYEGQGFPTPPRSGISELRFCSYRQPNVSPYRYRTTRPTGWRISNYYVTCIEHLAQPPCKPGKVCNDEMTYTQRTAGLSSWTSHVPLLIHDSSPPPRAACSVKTRRAPSQHCKNAKVYGHTTTAMHEMSIPPSPPPPSKCLLK